MLVWTLLIVHSAFANIGPPPAPRHGNITGDTHFQNISVVHEDLVINLAGIDKGQPVKIRATYTLECSALVQPVDLVFVANNLTESRYRVELDGAFVNGYLTRFDSLPPAWLPPDSIRWANRMIPYLYESEGLIRFRFDRLTPGQHTLIVDYDAQTSEWFDPEEPTVIQTFVYILKPTDQWKRFENFHLTVFTPDNWEFSCNLALEKVRSSAFSGNWKKLPASYLTMALRKPPYPATLYSVLFLGGSWVGYLLMVVLWMNQVAKLRIQGRIKPILKLLNTLGLTLLTSVFFFVIYFTNQNLAAYWLDHQANPFSTYGTGYIILTLPLVFCLAGVILFILDYVITRRLKTKTH